MIDAAIVGAGPYGLSIAAHFRRSGIAFRIFGRPMDSWKEHMPKGMMLKSDGFASNIYDPGSEYTLRQFCADSGIKYGEAGVPVSLDTFTSYGLAFQDRMVPELEDKLVVTLDRAPDGFLLKLDSGETLKARRVVLAVGITHFKYMPENLAHLPEEHVTHSYQHYDLEPFQGRDVTVLGGGASAIDLAGLLHEAGAKVRLVARASSLKFHTTPNGKPRSLWQQFRHPQSGLGPGMRSRFFADAPMVFHYLPERWRVKVVRTSLGPSAGWPSKEKFVGKVEQLLGYSIQRAEIHEGKVRLQLRSVDGSARELFTEHVIAGTGYKVDLTRLKFLSTEVRSGIRVVEGSPALSSCFESSVPGLYFAGVAAANSFGPVMRFAFGAGFAAERLTKAMAKSAAKDRVSAPASSIVNMTEEGDSTSRSSV
jgi:cation diffusion facilitator CzcD-associated flavoprotein CzcO